MPVQPIRVVFDVLLASGAELQATVDQRDYAALEAATVDQLALAVGNHHGRARFLAWSTLTRNGHYAGTWPTFNTTDCVDVQVVDLPGSEDEQSVPPGPTPAGADS